ncbi:MAG: cytochrome c [Verrucomicrobiales bacterium]|nr:cytochrome c [Verrucomicrobiales bacterium]
MRTVPFLLFPALIILAGCSDDQGTGESAPEPVDPLVAGLVFPDDPGQTYAAVCAVCHGPKGEGNRQLLAPSIAGLPAWFIELQLSQFREGHRGAHPDDLHGRQMRQVALLLDEAATHAVALQIEAMEKIPTVWTGEKPAPPLVRARRIYANQCMSCHRFNGTGERVFRSAPLIGLPDWYLAGQLKKYRAGWRGTQPADHYGAKMVAVSSRLSDQDIEEMAAYLAALAAGDDPRPEMD